MGGPGDHTTDMSHYRQVDDEVIETILAGEVPEEEWLGPLVTFARQVQEIGEAPPPPPSADLQSLLDRSVELASVTAPVAGPLAVAEQARQSRQVTGLAARAAGLGPVAKTALAAAAAVVFVVAAGVVGVAPRPVSQAVQSTVTTVTPFDLTAKEKYGEAEPDAGTEADSDNRSDGSDQNPAPEQVDGDGGGEEVPPSTDAPDDTGSGERETDDPSRGDSERDGADEGTSSPESGEESDPPASTTTEPDETEPLFPEVELPPPDSGSDDDDGCLLFLCP